MPYTETGAEKIKRKAYENKNKERAMSIEKQKNYERFGTTDQNIPQVNPMGDVAMPMSANMKKGGSVKKPTMKFETYTKTGKPAGMKTMTMASGGKTAQLAKANGCAVRGKTKGKIV